MFIKYIFKNTEALRAHAVSFRCWKQLLLYRLASTTVDALEQVNGFSWLPTVRPAPSQQYPQITWTHLTSFQSEKFIEIMQWISFINCWKVTLLSWLLFRSIYLQGTTFVTCASTKHGSSWECQDLEISWDLRVRKLTRCACKGTSVIRFWGLGINKMAWWTLFYLGIDFLVK